MTNGDLIKSAVRGAVGSGGRTVPLLLAIFLIAALVFGVSVACIKVLFSRRKVEKIMSKMRLADEKKIQELENEELAESEEARAAARERIVDIEEEVRALKESIQERRKDHARLVKGLESVVSWDDLTILDKREEA